MVLRGLLSAILIGGIAGTFNSIWWLQDDGTWMVVFDAGSPAAEPTDEQRALIDDDDDVALLGCGR